MPARNGPLHQIRRLRQPEVISAVPASSDVLDERQPTSACTLQDRRLSHADRRGAGPDQPCSASGGCSVRRGPGRFLAPGSYDLSPHGRRVPARKYLDPVQPTPSVPAIPPTLSEALAGPGAATAQDCLFAVGPRRTGSAARLVAGVLRRPPARPPHHAGRGRGRHRTNHPDARSHSLNVPEPLVPYCHRIALARGTSEDCGLLTDPDSSRQQAPETSAESVMADRRRAHRSVGWG